METQNVSREQMKTKPGDFPKITIQDIEHNIVHEHYFTAAEGVLGHRLNVENTLKNDQIPQPLELLTICVLTLRNGFTVLGKSACASPENFNQEIGNDVARGDAIRQIWALMGYELRSDLARIAELKHNLG